jgi:hypothetical protein
MFEGSNPAEFGLLLGVVSTAVDDAGLRDQPQPAFNTFRSALRSASQTRVVN